MRWQQAGQPASGAAGPRAAGPAADRYGRAGSRPQPRFRPPASCGAAEPSPAVPPGRSTGFGKGRGGGQARGRRPRTRPPLYPTRVSATANPATAASSSAVPTNVAAVSRSSSAVTAITAALTGSSSMITETVAARTTAAPAK